MEATYLIQDKTNEHIYKQMEHYKEREKKYHQNLLYITSTMKEDAVRPQKR
jgi:hypothetical protein